MRKGEIMKKLKNVITKTAKEIKQMVKKFPLTMGLILFVTLLLTIMIDQNFSSKTNEILEKIYLFCLIGGIGTFFTETFFAKKTSKIISYVATAIIGFGFMEILTLDALKNGIRIETSLRFLACYAMILILITIYKSIQNVNLTWKEYLFKLFRDLFHITITYIILNIGILLVTAIFVELILEGEQGSILVRLLTLIFGLFYVPAIIYSFASISENQISSFIKNLILYVLLPLVTISITIIYLYIAKIMVLKDMPQNTIYRILAGIFIAGFPVWNMAQNFAKDKKMIAKITKILPYLYTPFIVLQMYSIGVRMSEFGITPMRYISCLFIVFEIICLVLTFYKKSEKIAQFLLYAAVIVLIGFISPLHYENVSNWSQKGILEKVIPENTNFDELSKKDQKRVVGAYQYLAGNENRKKLIPDYLTEENKNKIEEQARFNARHGNYPEYISLDCQLELGIQEYSKISYVQSNSKKQSKIVTFENLDQTLDLSEKIDEIITKNENVEIDLEEDFKENNIVKISDTEDFFISSLLFSYEQNSKEINYLSVQGYRLQK